MTKVYLLALIGAVLVTVGIVECGWLLLTIWLGLDFLALAIAHWKQAHHLFGKRPDGTLCLFNRILLLPLLLFTWVTWHLFRILSREPAMATVTDRLTVGRRLLQFEVEARFDNYVDLTAEFSEPIPIRYSSAYLSFPILDASAPSPEMLCRVIDRLGPGRTFVHCAQGHGRTGLFAAALLLRSGEALSVDEALRALKNVRSQIRLNREQLKCLRRFSDQFVTFSHVCKPTVDS